MAAALAAPGRQLGSELLTIGDDGSVVGLRGTLPFDDEGTPPSNTLLVQHGVVVGRLHSRETAARFGERPTGNARAISFRHVPLVRLTNTYVANGSGTFADLIRDVKLGVYACDAVGSRHRGDSYSFTAGHGYMIRDGALAEPVKSVVLVGFVAELLGAVDRVAGDFRWHESGGGCGKGGQSPLPVVRGRTAHPAPQRRDPGAGAMITRLLDAARARVQMADAVAKTDETLTLRLRDGEVVAAHTSEQAGHNLRVVVDGRIGVAGTTGADADALFEAALASAAAGEEAPLLLPSPSPLPRVHTHVPRAAAASVVELAQLGRPPDRSPSQGRPQRHGARRALGRFRCRWATRAGWTPSTR